MKHWLILLFVGASVFSAPLVFAAPLGQLQSCPLIGDADVSAVVGTAMRASPFLIIVEGPNTQCVFQGSGIVDGVLVSRYSGFFGSEDVQPLSSGHPRLPTLLPRGEEVDLTAVDGVGDVAAWATSRNPGAAPDGLGRLLVRRGADAFVVGFPNGPEALNMAGSLAQVVIAQPPS